MRFAALVMLAALGCKEKETPATQPTTGSAAPSAPARPSLARPKVVGPGLVKVSKLSATVTYGEKELAVDGSSLGKIRDGVISREQLERLTRALEPAGASSDPIGIALEPTLSYLRVSELLFNLKAAGFRNLALLTSGPDSAVPLVLLDGDQVSADGLRPVVTVRAGTFTVWSQSGGEGTMQQPKAILPTKAGTAALTRALSEIVHRRWPDSMRAAEDRTIIVQIAKTEKAETLLQVLAAVRADGNTELFPDIYLAGGI